MRRVHIPKGTGGETRPIGIPTLEDKVLQRAVVMLLEPIYEQDFLRLLVWVPAASFGASRVGQPLEADHVERGKLSLGGRYPEIFRHAGSWPSAGRFSNNGYATVWCCD